MNYMIINYDNFNILLQFFLLRFIKVIIIIIIYQNYLNKIILHLFLYICQILKKKFKQIQMNQFQYNIVLINHIIFLQIIYKYLMIHNINYLKF